MVRLIQFLIYGHIHEWDTVSYHRLTNDSGDEGSRWILRCTKCGKTKKVDLREF